MKRILNKLKNRQGVTILFALLVFLLCILAGTAALTAAASNAGRYTHLESDQQKYLSVSSATDLLRGELSDREFKAEIKYVETYEWWYEPVEETESSEGSDPPDESESAEEEETVEYTLMETTEYELDLEEATYEYQEKSGWRVANEDAPASMFESLLGNYLKSMFLNDVVPGEWFDNAEVEIPPDKYPKQTGLKRKLSVGTDLAEKLSEVNGKMEIPSGGYSMTLTLGAVDSDASGSGGSGGSGGGGSGGDEKLLYTTSIQIPASAESSTVTEVKEEIVEIEEGVGGSPGPAPPTPPGPGGINVNEKGTRTTTTTLTFIVKWDKEDVKITRIKGGDG